jgi:hypothetical protein
MPETNAAVPVAKTEEKDNPMTQTEALKLMRKPFAEHQISKMCKPTKKDNQPGRCKDCGGYHKLPSVQLSYVGHAALTDRLLDADPNWTWEPLAYAPNGHPLLDNDGGMWIKLTVAGVTRLGYGDSQGKQGGDAMKERIGDALRNAAMRFGAALDLWHKGDLHGAEEETFEKSPDNKTFTKKTKPTSGHQDSAKQPSTGGPDPSVSAAPPVSAVGATTSSPSPSNIHGLNITDADLPENLQPDKPSTKEEQKLIKGRLHAAVPDGGQRTKLFTYMKERFKVETLSELSMNKWNEIFTELEAGNIPL